MTQKNNDKKSTKIARFGLIMGPLLFFILTFIPIDGVNFAAKVVLALTFWMGTWRITEAIPIYVTALLPLVLFPIFDTII